MTRLTDTPCAKIPFRREKIALRWHDKHYPGEYRRAYKCPACGYWHLTTTPLREVFRSAVR